MMIKKINMRLIQLGLLVLLFSFVTSNIIPLHLSIDKTELTESNLSDAEENENQKEAKSFLINSTSIVKISFNNWVNTIIVKVVKALPEVFINLLYPPPNAV